MNHKAHCQINISSLKPAVTIVSPFREYKTDSHPIEYQGNPCGNEIQNR